MKKRKGLQPLKYTKEHPYKGQVELVDKGFTTLIGKRIPKHISEDFECSFNPELKSLEGGPKSVSGNFYCSNNPELKSLEGAPEFVGKDFICVHTALSKEEVERYFKTSVVQGTIVSPYGDYNNKLK